MAVRVVHAAASALWAARDSEVASRPRTSWLASVRPAALNCSPGGNRPASSSTDPAGNPHGSVEVEEVVAIHRGGSAHPAVVGQADIADRLTKPASGRLPPGAPGCRSRGRSAAGDAQDPMRSGRGGNGSARRDAFVAGSGLNRSAPRYPGCCRAQVGRGAAGGPRLALPRLSLAAPQSRLVSMMLKLWVSIRRRTSPPRPRYGGGDAPARSLHRVGKSVALQALKATSSVTIEKMARRWRRAWSGHGGTS